MCQLQVCTDDTMMHAVGLCNIVSWSNRPDLQCGAAGWQHWLFPIDVLAGLLHLSPGHSCSDHHLGDQHNRKMDRGFGSPGMEFLGISPFHRWFGVSSKEGISCIPIVAAVYLYGLACSDPVAFRIQRHHSEHCNSQVLAQLWVS